MQAAVEYLRQMFAEIRDGSVSCDLLNSIKVDCYGSNNPLPHLAAITTDNKNVIRISPYDASLIPAIVRAVEKTGLNLSIATAKTTVLVTFPALSVERREELVRYVKTLAEKQRVAIRNIRRTQRKAGLDPEKETKEAISEIDQLLETKIIRLLGLNNQFKFNT